MDLRRTKMEPEYFNDDFYVILDNSNNPGSGELTHELYSPIIIPKNAYEVCLSEIEFCPKRPKIFGNIKEHGTFKMSVGKYTRLDYRILKTTDNMYEWFQTANNYFKSHDLDLSIFVEYEDDVGMFSLGNTTDRILKLPQMFARSLGFSKTEFGQGLHKAPNVPSPGLFSKISNHFGVEIELLTRPTLYSLNFLDENTEEIKTIADIVSCLTFILSKHDLDDYVKVSVNKEERKFEITPVSAETIYEFQLSETFNKILNLPKDFKHENKPYKYDIPSLELSENTLNVYMKGVKNTMINSGIAPLLKTVTFQSLYAPQRQIFSPRSYVPLDDDNFRFIRVYIKNENNREPSLDVQPLKVTIHFRKKRHA